ncbi:MAG: 30S ribosomal protein S6 [Candidatus Omnitrophica bacterium]|nr:30S ribosomal protein S6 [Candidatus Omnitrophota bacterium]MDD5352869.1 30S ribosomal protein S6 [Candidatus Omnitrophota bacterium]MDD5550468.1 30S ribosomal protein S6 [Candidatus Omnitrophota bacterium]
MRKYEVMFILRPDLNDAEKTSMFTQLKDTLNKFKVKINSADIWMEKRKLCFELSLKGKGVKFNEGLYYLIDFDSPTEEIKNINAALRLNENILRFLITAKEEVKGGV